MSKIERAMKILGFAQRARKLSLGMTATVGSIRRRKASAVILASDVSPNSGSKVTTLARAAGVRVFTAGTKDDFGQFFGRREVGIIGVLGSDFSKAIGEILDERG